MVHSEELPKVEQSGRGVAANVRVVTGYSQAVELSPELLQMVRGLVDAEVKREVAELVPSVIEAKIRQKMEYWNAFYMGAGLSVFAGLVGFVYFRGTLGLFVIAAATGPFLMSVLGLYRLRKRQ